MFSRTTPGIHRQFAHVVDWHGVLQWMALSRAGLARPRARGAMDADAIQQALRAALRESIPGVRSHCQSGRTAEDAFCADQDGEAVGSASPALRPRALET